MINLPQVSSTASSTTTVDPATGQIKLSSADFNKILMAQMATPDLSALFNSDSSSSSSNSSSSIFGGGNSSLFGSDSSLLSMLAGNTTDGVSSLTSLSSTAFSLSVLSNLINNTVTAVDPDTGDKISGKVSSIIVDGSTPMLKLESGKTVDPNTMTLVS